MYALLEQLDPATANFLIGNHILQLTVIVMGMTAVYAALVVGWGHMTWLRNVEQQYFSDIRIARLGTITRPETIKAKLDEIEETKQAKLRTAWANFWSLLLLGVLVPSGLMMFVTLNYPWLFPGQFPLIDQPTGRLISDPEFSDALGFVISQLTRAPLDFMEIFGFEVSRIGYDQSQRLFALLIFLYRSLEGVFLGAAGVFLYRVVRFRNVKGESQLKLEGKLEAAR